MLNSVPIPTDNVFKFYALFSLVLFIFCGAAGLAVVDRTQDVIFSSLVEIETLRQEQNSGKSNLAKIEVYETKMRRAEKISYPMVGLLAVCFAGSILGMVYGFGKWHTKIQPLDDEATRVQLKTAEVELETAKLQLAKLKAETPALSAKD